MSDKPYIHRFPVPAELRGDQLAHEITEAAGKPARVFLESSTADDPAELNVVGLPETDRRAIEQTIDSHVPDPDFGVSSEEMRLRQLAEKPTLSADEVQEALKLLLPKQGGERGGSTSAVEGRGR